MSDLIPDAWMPAVKMTRIIVHWTAGGNKANSVDRAHYHILIEGDGKLVRGVPSIALNVAPVRTGYAAHTRGANSGAIGVSLCGMAGAIERPFNPGRAPLTSKQWLTLAKVCGELSQRYGIAITDKTILTHAEVQPNLGIRQAGQWDIARLPFIASLVGPKDVGDAMRQNISDFI